MVDKKALSERDVCTKFISPAIERAGWDMQTQLREEVYITQGRILVRGRMADAFSATDQEGSFDAQAFTLNLGQNLQSGRFRLVIVLDSAPDELVRLAGYLETVAERLLIDLVTVSAYAVCLRACHFHGPVALLVTPERIDVRSAEWALTRS